MPVLVTAVKNRPSKRASRLLRACSQTWRAGRADAFSMPAGYHRRTAGTGRFRTWMLRGRGCLPQGREQGSGVAVVVRGVDAQQPGEQGIDVDVVERLQAHAAGEGRAAGDEDRPHRWQRRVVAVRAAGARRTPLDETGGDRVPAFVHLAHDRWNARMAAVVPAGGQLLLASAVVALAGAQQGRFGGRLATGKRPEADYLAEGHRLGVRLVHHLLE